jgi:hypothetical protein
MEMPRLAAEMTRDLIRQMLGSELQAGEAPQRMRA